MTILAPSILSADFVNLERDIRALKDNGADWVHIDVMDGLFVPNITIGIPVVKAIRGITDLPLDVHLMIDRPVRYVERFVQAGADWLTVHIEADTQNATLEALDKIRELGCKPSISLKPGTPAEAAEPYMTHCDMILVMTVEPGFGGQAFMESQLSKLRSLRRRLDEMNPACLLEVDGGINEKTAALCCQSGAEAFVTGSAYFRAPDQAAFLQRLHSLTPRE